ncbi:hypothetical protein SOVF_016150 isoform C [Spinacia oleracea]|nr:hypothetical protein SOVF_016150 isoform C [Spinacia oleracea]
MAEEEAESTKSAVLVRSWRTAFLTLRDETQTQNHATNTLINVLPVLDELIFAHFHSFVAAAPSLPPLEVTSDLMYMLNVAAPSNGMNEDTERALYLVCHLIYNIALRVPLALSSSAWSEMLGSFSKMAKSFIEDAVRERFVSENSVGIKATKDCLETTRHLISMDPRRSSISENIQLVEFLLHIIVCCHSELNGSYHSISDLRCCGDSGNRNPQHASLWKVQTTAFSMVGEAFTRVGPSFPLGTWQSVVEVLRKVMDALATKMFPAEDGTLSRFYTSVLHCLHLVLINRKGSLSDHLAAFVAALRKFLAYGLNNSSLLSFHGDKDPGPSSHRFTSRETIKKDVGAYKPPHLRRRTSSSLQQTLTKTSKISSDQDSSPLEFSSSDSDYSDSDGVPKDFDNVSSCKARVAAINSIQDLCEADPKAFIAHWTMLLPTNDVLQPRKYEATLMTCLLFDPFLKARLASASAIASMLEEPSSVALQVAEYRESTKCGSYMALSSSLGHILLQLHAGVLHLIRHERHTGLLTSLFKILMLMISSTPYLRMPGELLPRVLSSLRLRIEEGFPFKNDQTSLLVIAISCLTGAVSTSPSSSHVYKMFEAEISAGLFLGKGGSGVLITLLQHAEQVTNPPICSEALQVRAASVTCFAGMTCAVLFSLKKEQQQFIISSCINAANDSVPSVRAAACRAIGVIACFPEIFRSAEILHKFINAVEVNTRDQPVLVRITASWALANICDSFRHSVSDFSLDPEANFRVVTFLLECSLKLTTDGDKIKSNAVRALGNLSRVIRFSNPLEQGKCAVTCPGTGKMDNFSWKCTSTQEDTARSTDSLGCVHLLEKIVQAFLSCITTGNVKVQWNVCHALSNLFLNESLRMQRMDWCSSKSKMKCRSVRTHVGGSRVRHGYLRASSIYSILLLLLRDSSNFKIRIQAAAALTVPSTVLDYGSSFSDVVKSIQHILENVTTDQHSTPSFKYRIALEKQLTASMLHVLGLCSSNSHEPLKEFLLKKALFIECWLKDLCSSLETRIQQEDEVDLYRNGKKDLVSKAIQSLIEVYESKNQSSLAHKLQKLLVACG